MTLEKKLEKTIIDAYIAFHAIAETENPSVRNAITKEYKKMLAEIDSIENQLMGSA